MEDFIQDAISSSPSVDEVMKTLKDIDARLDNVEANSMGAREILYRIPGNTEYTRLAESLDQMWAKIDEVTNKVDQLIKDAD